MGSYMYSGTLEFHPPLTEEQLDRVVKALCIEEDSRIAIKPESIEFTEYGWCYEMSDEFRDVLDLCKEWGVDASDSSIEYYGDTDGGFTFKNNELRDYNVRDECLATADADMLWAELADRMESPLTFAADGKPFYLTQAQAQAVAEQVLSQKEKNIVADTIRKVATPDFLKAWGLTLDKINTDHIIGKIIQEHDRLEGVMKSPDPLWEEAFCSALKRLDWKNVEAKPAPTGKSSDVVGYIWCKQDIHLTREEVDDIMCCAFEGGINGWCCQAEVVGEYLGENSYEQISRGGTLILHDAESDDKWELDLPKFLKGVQLLIEKGNDRYSAFSSEGNDLCNVDAEIADMIIQYALFGELVFG